MRTSTAHSAHTLLCGSLGLAIAFAPIRPAVAWGAPPEDAADEADEEEPPEFIEARDLFERGVASFNAAQYDDAIDAWVEAYGRVPAVPEYARIKVEIIYNIATAQQKWFDIDQDIQHLRQAKTLLDAFIRDIPSIYEGDEATDESNRAKALLYDLDARIKAAEEAARERELELEKARAPKGDPELEAQQRRRNRALIITGASFTVLGAAGLGVMGAGVAMGNAADDELGEQETAAELPARLDTLDRGARANRLVVVGTAVGGVMLLSGVPLLITGIVFEQRRKNRQGPSAALHRRGRPTVSPVVGRDVAGLGLSGRF